MFHDPKIVLFEDQYEEGSIQFNNILNRIRSIYRIERFELDVHYAITFRELEMLEIISINVPTMKYNVTFSFNIEFGKQTTRVFLSGGSPPLTFNEISNIFSDISQDDRYSLA